MKSPTESLRPRSTSMSPARLDALALELFDIVLQDLSLDDIRQLRLISKETCARATRDRFHSSLLRKIVDLTQAGLEAFAHMTSQGKRLGCLVRHLTLTGVLYDLSILEDVQRTGTLSSLPTRGPRPEASKHLSEDKMVTARACFNDLRLRKQELDIFRKAETDVTLLSQAMHNIASGPQPKLDTLSLEVAVHDGNAAVKVSPKQMSLARYSKSRCERIFSTAMETFRLFSLVLHEGGPSIHHLEFFNRQSGPLPCKLPYDTFSHIE